MQQLDYELLKLRGAQTQVAQESSKVDALIQCPDEGSGTDKEGGSIRLAEVLAERDRLQGQRERLRCEEAALSKRKEIYLRLLRTGHNPSFVLELSEESLARLETKLVKLEQEERQLVNKPVLFVSWLFRNPKNPKEHRLPLLLDGLAKDPLRVGKAKEASVRRECGKLEVQLAHIKAQMELVMGYEDSEDQIVRLDEVRAGIENRLRQKQEELARLTMGM